MRQPGRTHLSEFGRGFQILLQAAEGRVVVLEVCARGLAAAAPQIAGHVMRNVVVAVVAGVDERWLGCVIAGTGAAGRGARLGIAVCGSERIAWWEAALGSDEEGELGGHLVDLPAGLSSATGDVNGRVTRLR